MTVSSYSDLAGCNVLITGGGSGIGACLVESFCAQGANVAFVSIDKENSESLCHKVNQRVGVSPLFIECDIADVETLNESIKLIISKIGEIDILINNAANDARHNLENFTAQQWDESLNVNLRPHFFTAQAVTQGMKKKQGGSIINIGSNSALLGLSGYPAYVAAKAGIVGLSKALARELGSDGIRVNTLIPGWVMTEKQRKLWATPEAVEQCLAEQCLQSTISEQDVANAALFLASTASKMITGQMIVVDGGRA
ncbi:SDR family NAD(P)-dependent oxidoreductase [Aliikangiella coralliicola]|uniref:SDR family oxidoreductase n=1 Tax=Aliikangiella coralliicola TaxID=2592383 RepID=A0A545UIC4_9GAMM|nr:SDR family oxidoreductase [Aliikangiella coralliicola]TQV89222.1 SDR family oxidoreductase [Aliikangiella coralliicola]